jgi:hypothetical protein
MHRADSLPFRVVLASGVAALLVGLLAAAPRTSDIPFRMHLLDPGASETAAVADINRDGRLDIVSGENWYEAPTWTKHHFRELNYTQNYVDDFSDLPLDVDGDGFPDIISVAWFGRKISWWKNPARSARPWTESIVDSGFPVEFALLVDLDNDGMARELLPQPGNQQTPQAWYEVRDGRFIKHVVSQRSYGHGIGAGDINGDGRVDILTPKGWLEAPADPRSPDWTFHADWEDNTTEFGFMYAIDLNGDGRTDVLTTSAHGYGVFWLEQGPNGQWTRHTIDDSWSQGHASTLVDLNRDGRLDLVTGKRYMAHNGRDAGEREPLGLYWYEYRPAPDGTGQGGPSRGGGGGVEWIRHLIDYGGRVGGGMQIPVVDIDGDGDLDLICAGKSGLFLIENLTRAPRTPKRSVLSRQVRP